MSINKGKTKLAPFTTCALHGVLCDCKKKKSFKNRSYFKKGNLKKTI